LVSVCCLVDRSNSSAAISFRSTYDAERRAKRARSKDGVTASSPAAVPQALSYLARYVTKTALSSKRLLHQDERTVTSSYRESQTNTERALTLIGEAFLHRFLQHVLPKGFRRVRTYGWLSPAGGAPGLQPFSVFSDFSSPSRHFSIRHGDSLIGKVILHRGAVIPHPRTMISSFQHGDFPSLRSDS